MGMNKAKGFFDNLPWFFHPRILGIVVISGVGLLVGLLGLAWLTRPASSPTASATAIVNIIKAPTATPLAPTPTAGNPVSPGEEIPGSSPAGEGIAVDAYVQIVGTGGDGLRLRDKAGLAGTMRLLGSEAEVFLVKDGPVETDGYTWWYLVGPFDDTRFGWAVANYLSIVQNP